MTGESPPVQSGSAEPSQVGLLLTADPLSPALAQSSLARPTLILAVNFQDSTMMDAGVVVVVIALLAWCLCRHTAHVSLTSDQLNVCLFGWHLHIQWVGGFILACKPLLQSRLQFINPSQRGNHQSTKRNHPTKRNRARPGRMTNNPKQSQTRAKSGKSFVSKEVRDWFQGYGTANQIIKP